MDLFTVPLTGLLKLLRINVNGTAYNPADDPFDDLENGGHRPQDQFQMMQAQRGQPANIRDVVIKCYDSARASVQGVGGDDEVMYPMRSSFLWDTWISMYRCPFMEEEPHRVRWIDGNHPIIQFLHFHRHPQKAHTLAVHRRKFGMMVQYAENEVQQFVDLLVDICKEMELHVADEAPRVDVKGAVGNRGKDEEEAVEEEEEAYVEIDMDAQASTPIPVNIHQVIHDARKEDQEYLKRVYMDIVVSMDQRQAVPRYPDIFYNMCVSQCPIPGPYAQSIRVYWLYENHAFTAHAALEHHPPIDAFRTAYGNCLVYQEGAITAVVESLIREFMAEGLEIDQKTPVIATAPPREQVVDPVILEPLPPPSARDLKE